jgi:mRNA-degrading endonuclease RelE of RelBE toxin-antitoxin system
MAYDISFQSGFESVFEKLDREATSRIQRKLEDVADCEWRSPTDWDYSSWSGQASGKFDWDSYRVFADVNEEDEKIIVHEARHRENLYR